MLKKEVANTICLNNILVGKLPIYFPYIIYHHLQAVQKISSVCM